MKPDIGSELQFLLTPLTFDGPFRAIPRRNSAMTFGMEKLERCVYPTVKTFSR